MSLLENIQSEIRRAGGRIAMGHLITWEAKEWFLPSERKYFADRYKWDENRRKRAIKKPRKDLWPKEDIQFILTNYGSMKTANIGEIINRSSAAIRLKFAEIATPEQKLEASLRHNKSRKRSNFK